MWIVTAWQHISPQVTVKGVTKCSICNAMDGTGMLWNGTAENRNGRSECEEDEGTDCGGRQ